MKSQVKAFFDNYKAAALITLMLIAGIAAEAQLDTVRPYQFIGAKPGYEWQGSKFIYSFVPPRDTLKLRVADSGAFAFKNGRYYQWSGYKWDTLRASGSGGGETGIAGNFLSKSGSTYSWPGPVLADAYAKGSASGVPAYGFWLDSMYYIRFGTGKLELYMQPEASDDLKIGPKTDINYDSSFRWLLTKGSLAHRLLELTGSDSLVFNGGLSGTSDTTNYQILIRDKVTGRIRVASYWPVGGSGGTTITNNGSFFRILTDNNTKARTLAGSNTVLIDSSSNANALTFKVDTALVATQYDLTQVTAAPAGSNTNVQYNNSGSLGADATFYFNNSTKRLSVQRLEVTATDGTATPSGGILINGNYTTGSGAGHDLTILGNYSLSGGAIAGIDFARNFTVPGDHMIALQNRSTYSGSGTFDILHTVGNYQNVTSGTVNRIPALQNKVNITGGLVKEVNAVWAQNPTVSGSGVLNSNVAIYVESQTAGTNYNAAILTRSGQVFFGDKVRFNGGYIVIADSVGYNNAPTLYGSRGNNMYPRRCYNCGLRGTEQDKALVTDIGIIEDWNTTGITLSSFPTTTAGSAFTAREIVRFRTGAAGTLGNVEIADGQLRIDDNTPFFIGGTNANSYKGIGYNFDKRNNRAAITDVITWIDFTADFSFKTGNGTALATPTLTERARLTASGEFFLGNFTDNGAYTIQNTGGLRQNGVTEFRGLYGTTPVNLLGRLADSTLTSITSLPVTLAGTGRNSHTAYALIAGGTTSTGAQQSLGTGTTGQFLMSNGSSALPTWATLEEIITNELTTTNNTPTTALTITPYTGEILQVTVDVVAIKTDGSGSYTAIKSRGFLMNGSSSLSEDASITATKADSYLGSGLSTATATITISGSDIIVRVTGETGDDIYWKIIVTVNRKDIGA